MRSHLAPLEWPLHDTVEEIAGERWRIEALPSFEVATATAYDQIGGWGDAARRADLSPMFGVVWGAARVAAHKLATGPALANLRLLEIGCGIALPSMIAARRGALVTATDQHRDAEPLLARNLARNGLDRRAVRFAPLDWRRPDDRPALGLAPHQFDRMIASDVLYDPSLPPLVAAMFARYLRRGGIGGLFDPGRPWLGEFHAAAVRLGLEVAIEVDEDDRGTEAFAIELTNPA